MVNTWGEGYELGLLAVVHGQTLEEQRSETGAGASTDDVEHHEALKSSTLVRELTEAVEREVDNLLTHGQTAQRRQRREERTMTRRERTMHVAVRH
jgi:hypothetical protein